AVREVEPGQEHEVVAGLDAVERVGVRGLHLQRGVGRAFETLHRGVLQALELRPDVSQGPERVFGVGVHRAIMTPRRAYLRRDGLALLAAAAVRGLRAPRVAPRHALAGK